MQVLGTQAPLYKDQSNYFWFEPSVYSPTDLEALKQPFFASTLKKLKGAKTQENEKEKTETQEKISIFWQFFRTKKNCQKICLIYLKCIEI